MIPLFKKVKNFTITYLNKEELKILEKEIFSNEIYKIVINSKKPVILDLGSHIGLSILYFKTIYPNSTIIGFEPNPNIFPILEENIVMNNVTGVTLHNIALDKKEGRKDFYIDSSGNNAFSTAGFTKDAWNKKQSTKLIQVSVKKASTYVLDKDLIDLMKMDIEGAELNVLEELNTSKSLDRVKNIILEYHPIRKNGLKKIIRILAKNGFKVSQREGIDGKDDKLILVVGEKCS